MNPLVYYSVSLLLYSVEVLLAIVIKDISTVFNFIGTFAGTSLSFFLPSAFFMVSIKKFGSESDYQNNKSWWYLSIFNAVIGVGFFVLFLYANIMALKG